jgi:two-component system, sensor histidine kinase and response regulator
MKLSKDKKLSNTFNKKILIIEDESSVRNALVNKFTSEKFEVLEAKNGKIGLKLALSNHPDIILLDIMMPVMNGITMLKKLRTNSDIQKIPIILLTNLNDSENIDEAMSLGVYDYLVKADWKLEDVVKKVKEKLNLN